ncbi:MAG: hypothetical protein V3V25_02990 [Paracoccaceae bacterium]
MTRGNIKKLQVAIAATAAAFSATVANAQTPNSPVTVNLSFSSKLSIDTNPNLAAVSSGTELAFSEGLFASFNNITQNQDLQVSVDTGFSFASTAGGGTSGSFNSPKFKLSYTRDSANSDLALSADYWSGDVTSSFDADPTSAIFIIVDTGTLVKSDLNFAYNWGLTAPLGFSLNASYSGSDYTGTSDPALFDSITTTVSAGANFRFSPNTNGSLTAFTTNYDSNDPIGTNSVTNEWAFKVTRDLATGLVLSGNAGYRDVTTATSLSTTNRNGFFLGLDATQPVARGTYFGGISLDDSGSSLQTALTVGRSMDFPDGSLTASITANNVSGGSTQILASASYLKQLPDGSITLDLSQSLTENYLSQDVKLSSLGVIYQKNLNSDSDLNLAFDVSRSEDAGAGFAATLNRSKLTASYSRSLTPDWNMSVGYEHRQKSGSTVSTANSDSVFLTLTRDLQFGF